MKSIVEILGNRAVGLATAVVFALLIVACGSGANVAETQSDSVSEAQPAVTQATETSIEPDQEVSLVFVEGEVLAPYSGEPDSAIGTTAPAFSAQTFDGETVEVDSTDGTGRLLVFFAHWCSHCQEELPEMVAWLADTELADGVEVVAISTAVDADRDNYPPSEWFEAEGWSDSVLADDEAGALAQVFGLNSFPYAVAIDGNGEVLARTAGRMNQAQFVDVLEELSAS